MAASATGNSAQRTLARRVAVIYFLAAAAWIVFSDLALLSFSFDFGGLISGSIAKGLLFCAVTSVLLYVALRRTIPAPATRDALTAQPLRRGGPIILFSGIAVAVLAISGAMFVLDTRHEEQDARSHLSIVLDLKTQMVEQWLTSRREAARSFAGARALREQVALLDTGDSPQARAALEERLEAIRSSLQVDAVLAFDTRGEPVAAAGERVLRHATPELIELARRAIAGESIWPQYFYRDKLAGDGRPLIDFVVPLRDPAAREPARGALVLRDDARRRFFGIVERWPMKNGSAEAVLVRQDGDRVTYLNDLRFRSDAALEFSLPVSQPDLVSARALASRSAALGDGVDYRGVAVISAWRPVAGTDWMIIANVSRDEVLAPVRRSATIWLVAILAIAAFAAFGVSALWRERVALAALRERMTAAGRRRAEDRLQASEERLDRYFGQSLIGMAITLPDKGFAEINDKFCAMLGYSREELMRKDWTSITHAEDLAADVEQFQRMTAGVIDGYSLDKRFIRKDGSAIDTTLSVGCVRKPDRSIDYIVALFQDITEQKRAEARVAKLGRLRASASAVNRAIVHAQDEDALYRSVSRICIEEAGFLLAWVGLPDTAREQLAPVAWDGTGADYVAQLRIALQPGLEGGGPTGIAARKGHSVICNDFLADPRTAPWHALGREYGIAASAAIPFALPAGGFGVLTVYDREAGRFDAENVALLEEIALDVAFALKVIAGNRELRESAERQRALLEQSIAGIYVLQDGRISYVNPRMREIFGYTPDERFDPDPLVHVDPEERAYIAAQIAERLADDQPANYAVVSLRKDGSRFMLGVSAHRVSVGGRYAIMAIAQDITEKARIEAERQERLQRYQAQIGALAAVSASDAIAEGDIERLAREITEAACRATGVERANVWLFDDAETELRCIDLYEATPARHSQGAVLVRSQFENEFRALKDVAYVNADEPLTDPRTAGYAEGYLKPLGITSMLDAVIRFSGSRLGLLCLEHVNRAHHWENDEIAFACQLADKLALAIVNRRRREAQRSLERANRALRTLSAGNEALVRTSDEHALLEEMCRAIVRVGGYRVALAAYADSGSVALKAASGIDERDYAAFSRPWSETGEDAGTVRAVLRTGEPLIVRGVAADPRFEPWREIHAKLGLASMITLPVRLAAGEAPFGTLSIGAVDADAFSGEEVGLLAELCEDLGYGVVNLRARVERRAASEKLRRSLEDSIGAIAATVEMRDPYTSGHERRVAELATAIAREMGLAPEVVEGIHFGALIHDLGKIQVPAEILSKPTRLSTVEYELIKMHPQTGHDILKAIDFPWPVAQLVLQHHERLDGSGYPQGLKGEQIILEARILAVADVVEAMASHRPYRPGLGIDKALAEIERGRGSAYDPQIADACLRLFREKEYRLSP